MRNASRGPKKPCCTSGTGVSPRTTDARIHDNDYSSVRPVNSKITAEYSRNWGCVFIARCATPRLFRNPSVRRLGLASPDDTSLSRRLVLHQSSLIVAHPFSLRRGRTVRIRSRNATCRRQLGWTSACRCAHNFVTSGADLGAGACRANGGRRAWAMRLLQNRRRRVVDQGHGNTRSCNPKVSAMCGTGTGQDCGPLRLGPYTTLLRHCGSENCTGINTLQGR
jgi:hypothetical protein